MFVTWVVRGHVIDNDVFVGRDRHPDADLEAGAVSVLVARGDHGDAGSDDVSIMCLQPLDFVLNRGAYSLRRLGSFKGQLQRDLHKGLSIFSNVATLITWQPNPPTQGIPAT